MKTFYLAQRYLFRGNAKHLSFIGIISCLGIALGVATLIIVISVMNGFDRDLMDKLMRFNYHVTVESWDESKLSQIKADLVKWPQITSASVFVQTQVFVKSSNMVVPVVVKGMDFSDPKEKSLFFKYVTNDYKTPGFWAGEGLKRRLVYDNHIEYYPLEKQLQLKQGQIAGTFKIGLYDIDNNYMVTDLDKAKDLSPNYLAFLGIRVSDPFAVDAVKIKIKNAYPQDVFVNTWIENNQALFSALKLEKITMFIILSLITLVASFNIFATLTVKVVEKTKDIGILRSLGFTNTNIWTIFSLQGLIMGIIGVACGSGLGLGLCLILQKYPFIKLPGEIYSLEYLPIYINYRDIAFISIVGILLAFISSLFPAVRASRLTASEALRYE